MKATAAKNTSGMNMTSIGTTNTAKNPGRKIHKRKSTTAMQVQVMPVASTVSPVFLSPASGAAFTLEDDVFVTVYR